MPIDEMITDLRFVLEIFETKPCHEGFANIQKEMMRIERFCEDMLPEED